MGKRTNSEVYAELLRDPRWQRKRLEIFERENFSCQECGAKDRPLHVHHCYYESGMKPWEYPPTCYKCLCEQCHETRGILEMCIRKAISKYESSHIEDMLFRYFDACDKRSMPSVNDWVSFCLKSAEDEEELENLCHKDS